MVKLDFKVDIPSHAFASYQEAIAKGDLTTLRSVLLTICEGDKAETAMIEHLLPDSLVQQA